MSVINILSPHVADMIAAGEVVERPGNVVKELMENAVDAGAKNITVELKAGGAALIRVTDDGCGMTPEDACNCFLRHATSKLKDEHGLEAISTMGFRGEALAAISAVSRMELTTRRAEDAEGVCVSVEGGDIMGVRPTGCPKGTVFTMQGLFYNTPARLKFMKSDRAEGAHCVQLALRVALGRPDISVRCLRDGKEEFFTPGDGKKTSAVYALLGRDAALSMLPVSGQDEGVAVTGFVSSPAAGRGNRAMQYFFVNGRSIKSQLLQAAVEQAYKNTLLVGRFPGCVIYLDLDPAAVDVNVHPTKTEVKFSSEKKIFDAVYYAALSAVTGEEKPLDMNISRKTETLLSAPEQPRAHAPTARYTPPEVHSSPPAYRASPPVSVHREKAYPTRRPASPVETGFAPTRERSGAPLSATPEQMTFFPETEGKTASARLVGEVMRTYIIAEKGDTMLLIDKHAAHERMNFDRLKAQGRAMMSQALLVPEPWHPQPEEAQALEENGELLKSLGFELESFGREDVIIRGVPDILDPAQAVPALEEICEKLRRGSRDLAWDGALQTISCKAAVKAGWDTDPRELQVLVDKVASGEIKYCPHGRPVAVTLSRGELDRQFKRIV